MHRAIPSTGAATSRPSRAFTAFAGDADVHDMPKMKTAAKKTAFLPLLPRTRNSPAPHGGSRVRSLITRLGPADWRPA